jgi:hypothetical protein
VAAEIRQTVIALTTQEILGGNLSAGETATVRQAPRS